MDQTAQFVSLIESLAQKGECLVNRNELRITIEYAVLLATFGAGLLLGTHHPLSVSTHHTVVHDIASASRIFVSNLAYTLMIGILRRRAIINFVCVKEKMGSVWNYLL